MVLRKPGLVGETMHLQIGRTVCKPINILGDRGRERLSASVGLLLLRLKLGQPKRAPDMIAACERIVASKAMHDKAVLPPLSHLMESERSLALCPGPGTSAWPSTTSPPSASAILSIGGS